MRDAQPMPAPCPECGATGKPVQPVTLRALLKPEFVADVVQAEYHFCAATGCDIVYHRAGRVYTKGQLTVAVGVKEAAGDRPLCYCFGHSIATIKEEIRSKGHSDAAEDIRQRMAGRGCACERTNPSGGCCLGAVARGVEIAGTELSGKAGVRGRRRVGAEALAKVGAALSAVAATSCCWLPLLLLACGVSGAGVAGAIEAYRPALLAVTVLFLAAAFYFAYRPWPASEGAAACAGHDCCAPSAAGGKSTRMQTLHRATLWVVTLLAVGGFVFPKAFAAFLGSSPVAADTATTGQPARTTTFAVSDMNCEGCTALVARALRNVPGVRGVDVDYPAGRIVVSSDADTPAPTEAVLQALEKAGFPGEVVGEQ
jgi:copper chaperone CopZ